MGLISYRFREFQEYDKLYPAGFSGDIDGIKKAINKICDGPITEFENDLKLMSKKMDRDIVFENEIVYSKVDTEEFESTMNARQILYNSIFISLFIFLETRLFYLCRLIENKNSISLNDIAGKGIYKYKKFLEKIHKINFYPVSKEWGRICDYNLLRNKIVHNHSNKINKLTEEKDFEKIKKLPDISIKEVKENVYFCITNKNFLTTFLADITNLIEHIYHKK